METPPLGASVLYFPQCRDKDPRVGIITEASPQGVCSLAVFPAGAGLGAIESIPAVYHRSDKRLKDERGLVSNAGLMWGCWDYTDHTKACMEKKPAVVVVEDNKKSTTTVKK